MSKLLQLAECCEKASAPSRLLDFEIHIAAVEDATWPIIERDGRVSNPNARMSDYLRAYRDVIDADDQDFEFPRYTKSIDAAMTLVPKAFWLTIKTGTQMRVADFGWPVISIGRQSDGIMIWRGQGHTVPLTLCAAALWARSAISPTDAETS